MKKIIAIMLLLLFIIIAAGISYLKFALPNVSKAPIITIELTPERIAHGKYLANHVTVCMDCHSTRDWNKFSGPITDGTLGKGGEYFGPEFDFPGKFYSKNITPFNLKSWTDGEIFRAITAGVDKDGIALFPVMPYHYYGNMDKEDIKDIIAYLRSLPEIKNDVPVSQPNFPFNLILNTIPENPKFSQRPNKSDLLAYGKYMTFAAGCIECHTPENKGKIIQEKAFSGGRAFKMPFGIIRTPNITPDKETGIGNWTDSFFVNKFKNYEEQNTLYKVTNKDFNTIMPWSMYAGMTTEDLSAIYAYLKTLKPVTNAVDRFTKAQ